MRVHTLANGPENLRDKFDRHLLTRDTPVPLDEVTRKPQLRGLVLKELLLALKEERDVPVLNRFPLQLNAARMYEPEYLVALQVNGRNCVMLETCCFSMKMTREATVRKVRQLDFAYRNCPDIQVILMGTAPRKDLAEYVWSRTGLPFNGTYDAYWEIPNGNSSREKVEKMLEFNLKNLLERSDVDNTSPSLRKNEFMECLERYHNPSPGKKRLPKLENNGFTFHITNPDGLARARNASHAYGELRIFCDLLALSKRVSITESTDPMALKDSEDHIWEKQDGGSDDDSNIQILRRSYHDLKTHLFSIYRRRLKHPLSAQESAELNKEFQKILQKIKDRDAGIDIEPTVEVRMRTPYGISDSAYDSASIIKNTEPTLCVQGSVCDYGVAASPVLNT
jgi:hypothetical protein